MKKILLSIGTTIAIIAPLATATACGCSDSTDNSVADLNAEQTKVNELKIETSPSDTIPAAQTAITIDSDSLLAFNNQYGISLVLANGYTYSYTSTGKTPGSTGMIKITVAKIDVTGTIAPADITIPLTDAEVALDDEQRKINALIFTPLLSVIPGAPNQEPITIDAEYLATSFNATYGEGLVLVNGYNYSYTHTPKTAGNTSTVTIFVAKDNVTGSVAATPIMVNLTAEESGSTI